MISMFNLSNFIIIVILIISLVIITHYSKKEKFTTFYKDRQLVGSNQLDRGVQPKSTWKSGDMNYETCYQSDNNQSGNSIPRKNTYYCNFGSSGELEPISGTYGIDFTNYNIYYQKIIKGKRLQGNFSVGGNNYTFDEYGRPVGKLMTVQQSKNICDELKDKCAGFIINFDETQPKNNVGATHFIAELIPGFEDPNTYDRIYITPENRVKEANALSSYQNYISYTKKSFKYEEKPVGSLNIPGQEYERRSCSIVPNSQYDLRSFDNMTLDDCKAACYMDRSCSGFNRSSALNDTQPGKCDLKKVNFDYRNVRCPSGYTYNESNKNCTAGWSWACGQDCAYSKCVNDGGTWIWLDYSRNAYTCVPSAANNKIVCQNQPGLVSYKRVGTNGADPFEPEDDFTVVYRDRAYKCLAGWKKNAPYIGCQNNFITIPDGYRIADNNDDSVQVIKSYPWGTHTLVVSDKTVIGTTLWNPGQKFFGWGSTISGNQAKVDYCSGSFLLIKK